MHFELVVPPRARAWVEERMDGMWWETNYEEGYMGFEMVFAIDGKLLITQNDDGYLCPDHVAWFLRQYLATWAPTKHVIFKYCWTGGQEHGGGACLVTSTSESTFEPLTMARQWQMTDGCVPKVDDYATGMQKMENSIAENNGGRKRP